MGKKEKRARSNNGFAYGKKNSILYGHVVYFKKLVDDIIIFLSITHSEVVEIMDKVINTIALNDNVNPNANDGRKSYIVPLVYKGKREDLGKTNTTNRLTPTDEKQVDDVFYSNVPKDYKIENIKYKQYKKVHKKK